MRLWGLLVVGTACQFHPGERSGDGGLGSIDASDAGDAADALGTVDASPDATPAAPFCDPSDTNLVACYEFEGNTNDASGHALNATQTNVSFVPGKAGMAMQFGATSAADVAENALLDPPFITIEAWIKPASIPATGSRMGVLDNQGQYGFFLYDGGNMRCIASNTVNQTNGSITANAWHHVACTHDGSTTTLYVDGVQVAQIAGGAALGSAGTTGISLAADNPPGAGSRLNGLIDQLRVFKVARTATQICQDAGACVP